VTAAEAYELTTQGGTTDFARVIAACEAAGSWCLIDGLAVNVFAEPVYTLDADLVVIASGLPGLTKNLREQGFVIEEHEHSLNARGAGSDLRLAETWPELRAMYPKELLEQIDRG
jgi:hypothetical protein